MPRPPEPDDRFGLRSGRRPPTDYTQRNVKLKLFVFIAGLMLVLAVIERARDEKTWQWLWKLDQMSAENEPAFNNRIEAERLRTADDPAGTFVASADANESEANETDTAANDATLDPVRRAWEQGWKDVFERLEPDQRMLLFDMLHAGLTRAALDPEKAEPATDLLESIARLWADYQTAAFQSVVKLEGDDQQLWVDVLKQVNGRFNDDLQPAMQGVIDGRTPTESDERTLAEFQATLIGLTRGRIQDDTVFRPAEREIWFYELDRVRDAAPEALAKQSMGTVAYLQLSKQPNDYRGQVVTIEGTVKLGYRVQAPANYLGIEQYYVLWVHSDGGPNAPIVIYALDIPPGFPAIKDKDVDRGTTRLHEDVVVTGVFFKRWAYPGKDHTYAAPLIVAKSPKWIESPAVVAADRFPTSAAGIGAIVGGALLVALLICLALFRNPRRPAHAMEPRPAELAALRDVPVPPTTDDALRELERQARGGTAR
jgi:hypothetical protein